MCFSIRVCEQGGGGGSGGVELHLSLAESSPLAKPAMQPACRHTVLQRVSGL